MMGTQLLRIRRDARTKIEVQLEPDKSVKISAWFWNGSAWIGTKRHSVNLTAAEVLTIASKVANILAHAAAQREKANENSLCHQ